MMRQTLALLVLIPFAAFSFWLVSVHGYIGFFRIALEDGVGVQVFLDLTISITLLFLFLRRDAERYGVALWPWFVLMLPLGSMSPLMYLVYTGIRGPQAPSEA